ncbi:MAG: GDP-L-fucose synthase [Proteobacteria bacterium]|nr:GDP-L-fucose synthase [Pseudomonadota bacterium]MBI3497942.1 GDP-L-fucose synthase [Pseudomonadota bacterium]
MSGRRVWVAGHRGLVGSAIVRRLARESCEVMTVGRERLDLTEQEAVRRWLGEERPDAVIVAAARVGGILANDSEPVPFLRDNLMIATNVIDAAHQAGVKKLLFLGSSCIYPRLAPQPMREEHLLTGELEPTNQWYAVAKIAGLKLAAAYRRQYGADFIAAMPTNLYGSGDNFDLATAHVVPALMRKAHEAKAAGLPSITVWGTGTPRRELLHVDDLADACVFLLQHYSAESHINVGTGTDVSISELAHSIAEVVGFQGELRFDRSRPDGAPRKLLDVSRLSAMGWTAGIPLRQGLEQTYRWFVENLKAGADIRARRPA